MSEPQYDCEDMDRFYALQEQRQRQCSGCGTKKSQCDYWKRQGRAACCPDCKHACPTCGGDLGGSFPKCSACQLVDALKAGE